MHSGLSGREIDRFVLQQEAKEGWQWYSDIDLRPWYSLIKLWRANSHYRPKPGMWDLFRYIGKGAIYAAILVLIQPLVVVLFAHRMIAQRSLRSAKSASRISERGPRRL